MQTIYSSKLLLCFVSFILFSNHCSAQSKEDVVRSIYDEALTNGQSYEMLEYLSLNIGHRLSGSPQAAAAVEWTRQKMTELGFDKVYLQEVMVPHWVRGPIETARIVNSNKLGSVELSICALGNSIGTGPDGILAQVVEVKNFEELQKLGKKNIEGKIVFFNRPMDPKHIRTFYAYGGAVDQRVQGATEAARYGAVGVVVRSMTLAQDDVPHTGTLRYDESVEKIPAVAISTNGADLLSKSLAGQPGLKLYFETHCKMLEDVLSYNVIGEITGWELPDEYITVGGHLDSWDLGDGSHDDGAGCVQSIEVLRLFNSLGIRPRRTLRAVMFMNEENGLRGGIKYAEVAKKMGEKHFAALESDAGGFTPKGFSVNADDDTYNKIASWKNIFSTYGVHEIVKGYGGADINPLKDQGVILLGLMPDSQRYFDYHHTMIDTFDKVNKRELELGSAAMAALIYLLDSSEL